MSAVSQPAIELSPTVPACADGFRAVPSGLAAPPSQPRPWPPGWYTVTVGVDGRQHARHEVHASTATVDSVVLRPHLGSDGSAFPAKAVTAPDQSTVVCRRFSCGAQGSGGSGYRAKAMTAPIGPPSPSEAMAVSVPAIVSSTVTGVCRRFSCGAEGSGGSAFPVKATTARLVHRHRQRIAGSTPGTVAVWTLTFFRPDLAVFTATDSGNV